MSFTTTALAALTLTILALGAPSTKVAYADTDPGFMRHAVSPGSGGGGIHAGGSRVIEPARKYSIADKKWMAVLSVIDDKSKVRGVVGYKAAGPWDSQEACNNFTMTDEDIRTAAGILLDLAVTDLGEDIDAVGVKCVPVQD